MDRFLTLVIGLAILPLAALRADSVEVSVTYGGKTTSFSAAEISALPHQSVKAFNFVEESHLYTGIAVRDLLVKAGTPMGEKLRGPGLRRTVVVHCLDHYD